ncbi:MAG: glutamate--tRNA ligase [Candidatus Nanoarchaeia archaeon]
MKDLIYKYTLQNAIKYEGKANPGAIIGKILSEDPSLKEKMKDVSKEVALIVKKVNAMSLRDQLKELQEIAPELLEEKKKEEGPRLKPLPNAEKGKVVMRMAPSPSGPLHVGHAYVVQITAALCEEYDGKFILRLEDTNPENLYPKAYEMIPDDANWLTNQRVDEILIQSERLEEYYKYAHELLEMGYAYICTCNEDVFRELSGKKEECSCRNLTAEENLKRWERMFLDFKPGEAVVRIKTNMQDPNPALRDWPALRINEHPHPRKGTDYRVWPLMNFSVAIDDHLTGVTHSIRGKDHMDNEKKQLYIYKYFKWKAPTAMYVGRINFEGFELSTTQTRKKIEHGEYEGWDDIRLPFLAAFKRRGYQPEAFRELALNMGLHEADKTLSVEEFYKLLNHQNKQLIDQIANRYFIIIDPVEIEIEDAPEKVVHLELHPDHPERGKRMFQTHKLFFIQKEDFDNLEDGKIHRLMECCNFKKMGKRFIVVPGGHEEFKTTMNKGRILHYLPVSKEYVNVEVLSPEKKILKGIGEPLLEKLEIGSLIQAERVGFMRLDNIKDNVLKFWFTHR